MTQSPDHPDLQFVQASGYTSGRPDGPPLWIVVHDMEAHELPTTAENTANYFATGAGGRDVSSHYCADNDSVVQCVLLRDVAWTVGNRPGNYRGINWELAGFASQSPSEWLDDFGRAMFAEMAPIVRSDAARYGIPLERRTVAELQDFKKGVTSHNDLRLAFGITDHTDPGANFPWDYFLAVMNGEDMATPEDIAQAVWFGTVYDGEAMYHQVVLARLEAKETRKVIDQIAAAISAGGGNPDTATILAAIDQAVADVKAEIRDAVADLGEGGTPAVRNDPDA